MVVNPRCSQSPYLHSGHAGSEGWGVGPVLSRSEDGQGWDKGTLSAQGPRELDVLPQVCRAGQRRAGSPEEEGKGNVCDHQQWCAHG